MKIINLTPLPVRFYVNFPVFGTEDTGTLEIKDLGWITIAPSKTPATVDVQFVDFGKNNYSNVQNLPAPEANVLLIVDHDVYRAANYRPDLLTPDRLITSHYRQRRSTPWEARPYQAQKILRVEGVK